MRVSRFLRFVEATSVLLFFLQALRVIFSVLFGIIYDQVFAGSPGVWLVISVLLVLLALLCPIASPSNPKRSWVAVTASLAAVGRVAFNVNDATVRYWAAIVVLASAGLYLSSLLIARRSVVIPALLGALVLDQVLRAAGQTYDISLRPVWLAVQAVWSAVVVMAAAGLGRRVAGGDRRPGAFGGWAGVGLGAWLFLETSLLTLPNGVARWSGTPYALWTPVLVFLPALLLLPRLRHVWDLLRTRWPWARGVAGAGVIVGLMIGSFAGGVWSAMGVVLAQACALLGLVCLVHGRPAHLRPVGPMVAVGLGVLLVLNFLLAFAFTYPYALPLMRDLGWAVYLIAAAAVAVGMMTHQPVSLAWDELGTRTPALVGLGLICLALTVAFAWPQSVDSLPESGVLRLATYNIHYGYDKDWHFNLEAIAETIRQNDVDVAALQEVDTGRLTSYAVDDAYYLARRLHMNVAYLPAVEHLTGIALLYRGPQAPIRQRLLTSLQEQTGILEAVIPGHHAPLHAFGIWMGLSDEDTQRQIREALEFIGDATPASFGGDFNAEYGSPVAQAVVASGFQDPFTVLGITPVPLTDPAVEPTARIDYVWLREVILLRAWVPDSLASDHRMVVVEVEVP
jgi:endonuclease/exonuclease/phosphatase family metal-dependent hydrolase